jgi:hypothetical protein
MEGPSHSGPGGVSSSNGMSRAERFEDEKRRIIDSCFGKKDEDGSCKIMSKQRVIRCATTSGNLLTSSPYIQYWNHT